MKVQTDMNEIAVIQIGRDLKISVQTAKSTEILISSDIVNYELFDGDANHIETLASVTRDYDSPQVLAEVCAAARAMHGDLVTS